jgi:hypothetical protein
VAQYKNKFRTLVNNAMSFRVAKKGGISLLAEWLLASLSFVEILEVKLHAFLSSSLDRGFNFRPLYSRRNSPLYPFEKR